VCVPVDSVADVRHNLASPKLLSKSVQDGKMSLSELLDTLNQSVVDQVKATLEHLQVCLCSDRLNSKTGYSKQNINIAMIIITGASISFDINFVLFFSFHEINIYCL